MKCIEDPIARCSDCSTIEVTVPAESRISRFASHREELSPKPKQAKSVMLKTSSMQSSGLHSGSHRSLSSGGKTPDGEGSQKHSGEMSHSFPEGAAHTRSSDGMDEAGNMTPNTKAEAVEAMRSVLARAEFTPSERAALDLGDEEEIRILQNKFLDAARSGNLRGVVEGLVAGVDVECRTLRGQTALMLASAARTKAALQVIAFLVEARCNVDAADENGWTPLLYASRNNIQEAAEMLIKSKANVNARAHDGATPAMLAATESGDDLVISLIGRKVGLERAERKGWTLLFFAVEHGREDLVRWLLKKKANCDAKAKDRTTCLMVASEKGYLNTVKMLLHRNAVVNTKNVHGNSALLLSIMFMHEAIANHLVEHNADPVVQNKDGDSAISVAAEKRMGNLKNILDVMARKMHDRTKEQDEEED